MKNITKNGFSLIEMLVILMVISIISAVVILDYDKRKSSQMLLLAARQIAEDIRVVQNNTVDVLKFSGSVPQGGYGIKFSISANTSYILFADRDGDKQYISPADGLVKTATLPQGIVIDSVETNLPTSGQANIVFIPPYGVSFINNKNASNNSGVAVVLTIRLKKLSASCPSSDCRTIEITSEGKITK